MWASREFSFAEQKQVLSARRLLGVQIVAFPTHVGDKPQTISFCLLAHVPNGELSRPDET